MRTEDVASRFADLDTWPTGDLVASLVEGQLAAIAALHAVRPALVASADAAAQVLEDGNGRLVYAGAGASGRLAVQDGVELFPTYGWPHDRLVYLMAGGEGALVRSVEGAEDDAAAAEEAVSMHGVGSGDVVVAVAASGATPFTVRAAERARRKGALVVGIANNAAAPLLAAADHPILLQTGPEVIAGSTRMAAGTAQKAALNVLSTAIMVRLGRVHSNLMVAIASTNVKLAARRAAMLRRIVPVDEVAARSALDAAGGHVATAALVAAGADMQRASSLLAKHAGRLRPALRELSS
ncbi:MAG: N-acetylmuramic acid 6-phosphate etherase [Geminicoccaceae bacterium]|nr:N-acetylmuramic acid 6-phosphate etherase [Geminicoccaceae bacterium]